MFWVVAAECGRNRLEPASSYQMVKTVSEPPEITYFPINHRNGKTLNGTDVTQLSRFNKPSGCPIHKVNCRSRSTYIYVTGAPYREVNSKVATAPNTQSRR